LSTVAPTGGADLDGRFRDAMASFPSGVTIVTTADESGRWWGFTATSFCSVSMNPPLVLVCVARSAECFPVFEAANSWVIHVIHHEHAELATLFATRGAAKFADGIFSGSGEGHPVLADAAVTLHCGLYARHPGGDHSILIGKVDDVVVDATEDPAVYFRRTFHTISPVR
jgi:flavin reductase ActVB